MPLSILDIEDILKTGDFSRLKGQLENSVFDVKEFPYHLENEENKRGLCKDLTSFANSGGGFIIVGVSEIPEPNSPHRRVDEVKGITKTEINKQMYAQAVTAYIYPRLHVEFGLDTKLDGRDVFYIKVPPDQEGRPYLVDKEVNKNEGYFAYYVRTDEHGITVPTKQIHEYLVKGLQFDDYLARMDSKLDLLVENSTVTNGHIADDKPTLADLKKLL